MALTLQALAQHEQDSPYDFDRVTPPYAGEHSPNGKVLQVMPMMDNFIHGCFEQYDLDNNGIDTRDEMHGLVLNLSSDFRVGLTKQLLAQLVPALPPWVCLLRKPFRLL